MFAKPKSISSALYDIMPVNSNLTVFSKLSPQAVFNALSCPNMVILGRKNITSEATGQFLLIQL